MEQAKKSDASVEMIADAGVVGAGGGGFPTHIKLAARADVVIINAAECEPLLHKDKEIIQNFPAQVVAGLHAAMKLVGASRGIVGIKKKYADVIAAVGPYLDATMSICPLADAYPVGDEMILVYDAIGKIIPPGGLPLSVGAVVINAETALNISLSPSRPVTEKYLTVAGAVASPCTIKVPIGTSISACIAAAGGANVVNPAVIVGGVMMGRLADSLDEPVTKTTGGVIVLPESHVVVRRYRRRWEDSARIARAACDQCSFCTELCPRYLLGHPVHPHLAMRNMSLNLSGENLSQAAAFCCQCNLCSMYSCPEDLDPQAVCANAKKILASQGKKASPSLNPSRAALHLENRRAPIARLMTKLALHDYDIHADLRDFDVELGRVRIPLKQHAGAAATPTVSVGQRVSAEQMIGSPAGDVRSISAAVHASIDGVVTAIDDGMITIER